MIRGSFDIDSHPGKPKILFIGLAESSHTHSWINLLDEAEVNVRLFGLPGGVPPDNWKVRTYVTGVTRSRLDPKTRARFYGRSRGAQLYKKGFSHLFMGDVRALEEKWLAQIIKSWRPDIIHTLGLDPAAHFYFRVRQKYKLQGNGKWVLQLRGGSDLALNHLDAEKVARIKPVVRACDQILSDNRQNFKFVLEMGVREEQLSRIGTVPGTGGIDVDRLSKARQGTPSERRIILWPKAYECEWSKALPVLEAIQLAWEKIRPCEICILSVSEDVRLWLLSLPEEIRQSCRTESRLPREKVLELMGRARVMLAPSLVDGTPNTMFEAMSAGAFPIVSPLETIRPVVENEQNVLFARNLYPEEIATALSRAMTDDALVDSAARANLSLVRKIADRAEIRPRVIAFYESLLQERRVQAVGHVSSNVEEPA
jgi:glycosyltransferase involved in cell wall biosynthesis